MREYTKIITIKVVASVMAESEHDAEVLCRDIHYSDDPSDPPEYYGTLPRLIHPQVIDDTAYTAVGWSHDDFKARSFKDAYREIYPEDTEHEPRPIVFPPRYPGLPE